MDMLLKAWAARVLDSDTLMRLERAFFSFQGAARVVQPQVSVPKGKDGLTLTKREMVNKPESTQNHAVVRGKPIQGKEKGK